MVKGKFRYIGSGLAKRISYVWGEKQRRGNRKSIMKENFRDTGSGLAWGRA